MKKDRNAFFESSQYNSSFTPNMMQPQMNNFTYPQNAPMPYQTAHNSSTFYAGPDIPMNTYPTSTTSNDLENKVARLERNIQKLENRISKLESTMFNSSDDSLNSTSNMYMI